MLAECAAPRRLFSDLPVVQKCRRDAGAAKTIDASFILSRVDARI
jgi:hypothetical protein